MNAALQSTSEPRTLPRLLVVYWRRWAIPAAVIAVAAAVYAFVAPKTWQATQALIVRAEAGVSESGPGKFHGAEELKAIEETIVELAKGRRLLKSALMEIGPPPCDTNAINWPTELQVAEAQKSVKVVPPKGVEFGTSEVFYLEVRDKDRERVAALCNAICRRLQIELQELRDAKAQSMTDELNKAVGVAKSDLAAATTRLAALENSVGSDLPELRSLLDSNSSDTSLRRTVSEIENELRQVRAVEKANRQMLDVLKEAVADPGKLLAAPVRLLDAQPALRRLKDGLVDAQLRTAMLQGKMSPEHPEVIASKYAEAQVARRLHDELTTAARGIEGELQLDARRIEMLEAQGSNAAGRLGRLAGVRAEYANLLAETAHRSKLLEHAEQALTDARSSGASARAASLITAVDTPDTGTGPVSPGRAVVILAGVLGGLLTGVGIVLMTVPTTAAAPQPAAENAALAGSRPPVIAELPFSALVAYALPPCVQWVGDARSNHAWSLPAAEGEGGLTFKQALKILDQRGKVAGSNPS